MTNAKQRVGSRSAAAWCGGTLVVACSLFAERGVTQDAAVVAALEREYVSEVRTLLQRYCFDCHAGDVTEADVDLAPFKTVADIRRQLGVWLKVREMFDSGQMPPKAAAQPTDTERAAMRQWVTGFLTSEAKAHAGDPGPVLLRRLSNAEYNYTIRDLTGIESLDPTREFPVDGAAGEGFTNAGSAQGMSPALVTKYLDAAKEVAEHAVLLPDGIRFSVHRSRRDRTDEWKARIQAFYRQFTEDGGGSAVNLQGIKFDTNQGGRLPLDKYVAALLAERQALHDGRTTVEAVARARSLNARYLTTLWNKLSPRTGGGTSPLMDALRERFRTASSAEAPALVAELAQAQQALWKFNSIGHLGREGGPTSWMEPVVPLETRQEFRVKLPEAAPGTDLVVYLAASDLGDGNAQDHVVWENPRIEFAAAQPRPPIPLRDVRSLTQRVERAMASELPRTVNYLKAIADLRMSSQSVEDLARSRGLNAHLLKNWSELVGLGNRASRQIRGHFTQRQTRIQGYEEINGWGSPETPSLLTNRSRQPISFLTLTVPARGVTVHPSPTQESVVAWKCPVDGRMQLEGLVADADDKCGNGAAWRVELLSEAGVAVLARGVIDNGKKERFGPLTLPARRAGDVVSLVVSPRDGNHGCDTTQVELKITESDGLKRCWDLASDVVDRILTSNPLADGYGNPETWHFCARADKPPTELSIPPSSTLAQWRAVLVNFNFPTEVDQLAAEVKAVLTAEDMSRLTEPDRMLRQQLTDWKGPLDWLTVAADFPVDAEGGYGLDPRQFGRHLDGTPIGADRLASQAPQVIEVRLPARLAAGTEFVTAAALHAGTGREGSVQLQVMTIKPEAAAVSLSAPMLVCAGSQAERRLHQSLEELRNLFPPALCYARIVPVDEVVTLLLFYREDDPLKRLMLDDRQVVELDRLWDELTYISQEPLALTVAFEQISEFATQDRPDLVKAFAPLKKPINERAEAFRQRLVKTEPIHVTALLTLADRAWRRPLSAEEQAGLRGFYAELRATGIPHEEAIELTLARILASPAFLYKREQPAQGQTPAFVSGVELASRLSYFLWSSAPDDELRAVADADRLTRALIGDGQGRPAEASDGEPTSELLRQTRRMLQHPHTRRLAIQFACQWLHLRDFDKNDDKNEKLFPEFAALRGDMYEETVRFFEEMFRRGGSILALLDADHTFLNGALAKHYGIAGIDGSEWRRVDGVRSQGRGGILAMASMLASQSGASRTSPILRGNWVSETLLGERLPRPPANVPQLPEAVPAGLTARQLIEQHSSVPACAKCHAKIDPYGFALEQYDAIGRLRGEVVDTRTKLVDGQAIEGVAGLRSYLFNDRRDDVVRQFCRKLLGFAVGRELQLSDELLLDEMKKKLEESDYRFDAAVETIVSSQQFRMIRPRGGP